MEYTQLGRLALNVSRVCLGTMNFGPFTTEPDSYQIMDHALDQGINFFDTANVYGWKLGEGITEQIVGRWFAQGGGRREKVVLATKVYNRMGEWPNTSRLSALHIRQACDESLRRLQTDYIDLYQMHHIDRTAPWDEIWQAMEILVQQGKVIYVGSSNFAGWHIAKANEIAKNRNFLGLVSEQSLYNLNARMVELEVVPAVEDYGMGLIPWSPLAGGLLGGVLQEDRRRSARQRGIAKSSQRQPRQDREVRSFLHRDGRASGGCRAGVAAGATGGHRADYRTAHDGTARQQHPFHRHQAERRAVESAGRDLPRSRRRSARSLRLVEQHHPFV